MKLNKAFNIIELIFVIIILGILAAVAIPKLQEQQVKAQLQTQPNSAFEADTTSNDTTGWN